jgi:putative spermidine/putrescine transport system substrate-binding protein
MEPGWMFMKELAKSGNIGRVVHADAEVVNTLTSGETSVTYASDADFQEVAKNFPVTFLTKVAGDKGLKTAFFTESWVVLKGKKSKAAKEFANFTTRADMNEAFNMGIGSTPANSKAKATEKLKPVAMTPEELTQYSFVPDWGYLGEQASSWMKRWEQEIVPLLK